MEARFTRREQVWAKVDPYPWWPGKIINIHIQQQQIVYKILFFNDNTYAYLPEEQLAAHATFDRNANSHYPPSGRLTKAIRMADEAFLRSQSVPEDSCSSVSLHQKKTGSLSEEERIPHANRIITPINSNQKQQRSQLTHGDVEIGTALDNKAIMKAEETTFVAICSQEEVNGNSIGICLEEITNENIMQVLKQRVKEQRKFEYNYENRKKIIMYKAQLKKKLLERYNLHALGHETFKEERVGNACLGYEGKNHSRKEDSRRRQKTKIHRKNTHNCCPKYQRDQCIKKLYQTAKKSLIQRPQALNLKDISMNLIKRLSQVSQQNEIRFKSLFIALIRSIEELQEHPNRLLSELAAEFSANLDKLENEKPEDEEGSRMTQISMQAQ